VLFVPCCACVSSFAGILSAVTSSAGEYADSRAAPYDPIWVKADEEAYDSDSLVAKRSSSSKKRGRVLASSDSEIEITTKDGVFRHCIFLTERLASQARIRPSTTLFLPHKMFLA